MEADDDDVWLMVCDDESPITLGTPGGSTFTSVTKEAGATGASPLVLLAELPGTVPLIGANCCNGCASKGLPGTEGVDDGIPGVVKAVPLAKPSWPESTGTFCVPPWAAAVGRARGAGRASSPVDELRLNPLPPRPVGRKGVPQLVGAGRTARPGPGAATLTGGLGGDRFSKRWGGCRGGGEDARNRISAGESGPGPAAGAAHAGTGGCHGDGSDGSGDARGVWPNKFATAAAMADALESGVPALRSRQDPPSGPRGVKPS